MAKPVRNDHITRRRQNRLEDLELAVFDAARQHFLVEGLPFAACYGRIGGEEGLGLAWLLKLIKGGAAAGDLAAARLAGPLRDIQAAIERHATLAWLAEDPMSHDAVAAAGA